MSVSVLCLIDKKACNQLRIQVEAKTFLRGAQIFKLRPIVVNYVQHVFPGGGRKNFHRVLPPSALPGYGPVDAFQAL